MSVCLPFTGDCMGRAEKRGLFNIVGSLCFCGIISVLPGIHVSVYRMIGGIGVGYSAGYAWQTAFNTFGALSIAAGLFGTAECSDSAYRGKHFWKCVYCDLQ